MNNNINEFYFKILSNLKNKKKTFYKVNNTKISYFKILKKVEKFYYIINKNDSKRIGLYCDKSENYYSAVIAILLSGKTWVQLSKSNPIDRNRLILSEGKIDLILSDIKIYFTRNVLIKYFNDILRNKASLTFPKICPIKKENLSCIFFTSGSTGLPKGVKITYRSMIASLNHQIRVLEYKKNDIFSDFHESSFVMSLNTILPCIKLGSTISPLIKETDKIIGNEIVKKNKISVLITVPSYILYLNNISFKKLYIKKIILCGENCSLNIFNILKNKFNFKSLYNCYGATELSPWAFSYKYNSLDDKTIKKMLQLPIGSPFKGIKIIKNKNREMLVSGNILSEGYLNKSQNRNKFIQYRKVNFYNTGDLFTIYKKKYFILGRNDSQIKLNGFRINLNDIDANLKKNININFSFTFFNNNMITTVYNAKKKISDLRIRNFLENYLPRYMLPKRIYFVKKVFFNKNGKIDRSRFIQQFS
jgi:D-alanine--poly(phosphoribitol) ligase subunit 1